MTAKEILRKHIVVEEMDEETAQLIPAMLEAIEEALAVGSQEKAE